MELETVAPVDTFEVVDRPTRGRADRPGTAAARHRRLRRTPGLQDPAPLLADCLGLPAQHDQVRSAARQGRSTFRTAWVKTRLHWTECESASSAAVFPRDVSTAAADAASDVHHLPRMCVGSKSAVSDRGTQETR